MVNDSFGMMEGAFFVGRYELLKWVNDFLGTSFSKVEQMASAVAYCQLMDAMYPGQVNLKKVNFHAKHDYEFVNNFKVLQAVFAKNNIQKFIDVPRLVIAKYQDNLEFFQWMKRFFDLHYNGQEYDAVGRRLAACPNAESNPFFVQGTAKINPVKPRRTAATPALGSGQVCMAPGNTVADRMVENTQTNSSSVSRKLAPLNSKPTPSSTALSKASPVGSVSDSKVVEMTEQLTEMKLTVDGLEKERDFYFGKLRDIEILCQTLENQDTPIIQEIQRILYAAEDDFAAVDEQGQTFNNKENNEMVTA